MPQELKEGGKPPKGFDCSEHPLQYELTCSGEPICLIEYSTRLANTPNVHVIQIDDYFGSGAKNIRLVHGRAKELFNELVLPERHGREKFILI